MLQICLKSETVTTISGTGELGNDKVGGKSGVNQVLSSPWDVKKYCSKHLQTSKCKLSIVIAIVELLSWLV